MTELKNNPFYSYFFAKLTQQTFYGTEMEPAGVWHSDHRSIKYIHKRDRQNQKIKQIPNEIPIKRTHENKPAPFFFTFFFKASH